MPITRVTNRQSPDAEPKTVNIISPTNSEKIPLANKLRRAITAIEIADHVAGTSPSVTWNIQFATTATGTPINLFATNRTTTSTTGASTTTFNNGTIPLGSYVWLITSAVSGTITMFSVSFYHS
jgi:hypothetical protein